MAGAGRSWVEAVAAKDHDAVRALLAPDVDFRALTPGRPWEATTSDAVLEIVFGHEFEGTEVPTGSLDITMHRDDLRHQPTRAPMHTVIPPGGIDDKVVVLVDDVLYSGRTIRAALDALSDLGRP